MDLRSASKSVDGLFPRLGHGLGLRSPHYSHILQTRPPVAWFEVISENFMGIGNGFGGRPIHILEQIRENYPIVMHGVSLSIGSVDPLKRDYLEKLKVLVERFQPAWVSDHLCWTGVDGENIHDLLPLPYTEEAIKHIVDRVNQVQDFLGRRFVLENVSSYLTYEHSTLTEWDFLAEIANRADCGILLDVNNVYVSSVNHGFDPKTYFDAIPAHRVAQFHLAGHQNNGDHLIDTHDHPVCDPVWELYDDACRRFGNVSTLLERDDHIPPFEELFEELTRAKSIQEKSLEDRTSPHSRRVATVDEVGSNGSERRPESAL